MRAFLFAVTLVFMLTVAACGGQSGLPSPANTVFAAKNTFVGLQTTAIQYTSLPRCGAPTSPPLCSDQATVLTIRKLNNDAVTTLDAAEKTVRDPTSSTSAQQAAANSSTNAVGALQTVLTQTKGK